MSEYESNLETIACQKHGKLAQTMCLDCEMPLCSKCELYSSDHKTHSKLNLRELIEVRMQSMELLNCQLTKNKNRLFNSDRSEKVIILDRVKKIQKKYTNKISEYLTSLQQKINLLKNEFEVNIANYFANLKKKLQTVENNFLDTENYIKTSNSISFVLKKGFNKKFKYYELEINKPLEYFTKECVSDINNSFMFTYFPKLKKEFFKKIQKYLNSFHVSMKISEEFQYSKDFIEKRKKSINRSKSPHKMFDKMSKSINQKSLSQTKSNQNKSKYLVRKDNKKDDSFFDLSIIDQPKINTVRKSKSRVLQNSNSGNLLTDNLDPGRDSSTYSINSAMTKGSKILRDVSETFTSKRQNSKNSLLESKNKAKLKQKAALNHTRVARKIDDKFQRNEYIDYLKTNHSVSKELFEKDYKRKKSIKDHSVSRCSKEQNSSQNSLLKSPIKRKKKKYNISDRGQSNTSKSSSLYCTEDNDKKTNSSLRKQFSSNLSPVVKNSQNLSKDSISLEQYLSQPNSKHKSKKSNVTK